jgi:hypothetical protein
MNKMRILQELVIEDSTLIFTEEPEKDIIEIQKQYEDEDRIGYMGYETPILTTFKFLGKEYPCISFWHDNEDVRDIDLNITNTTNQ